MKTVYKYPVPFGDTVEVEIPVFAKFLKLDVQHGFQYLWALVDTDEAPARRTFHWRGTGHDCSDVGHYVGTVMVQGGAFVFHLFEGK